MPRCLSVFGSAALLCGAWSLLAAPSPAPAAGGDDSVGDAAEANTPLPVRVASVDGSAPLRRPADGPDERALRRCVELLQDGLGRLDRVPQYTAVFRKREAVDGCLLEPQAMELTLRHEPFALHMAWVEGQRGRTLLYEAGRHGGDMLVNPGGWKGRLTGTLRLNPEGTLAKQEARHPITQLGLKRLAEKVLRHRLRELADADGVTCRLSDGHEHDGRPAWRNELVFATPGPGREFRRSVVLIDREWNLPVYAETYGWPTDGTPADQTDARTLLGRYSYTDVRFPAADAAPPAADFAAATGFRIK